MHQFELLASDNDETRLLCAPDCGYSIALAGHPHIAAAPAGKARYDVVLALQDLPVGHGFRIDNLPADMEPQALAVALCTAYRNQRATGADSDVKPLPMRPPGALAGAHVIYSRRDVPEPTMEQVWVVIRPSPVGLWSLYHTCWFRNADVNNLRWAHLRASFIDQHAWDGKPRDTTPTIWPASAITLPSAKLDLTEDAWKEAAAKRLDVGHLTSQQVLGLAAIIREFAQSDLPPRAPVPEMVLDTLRLRLTDHGPPQAAAVLFRNLVECKTRHDLRGWAWQCTWAIGNRTELDGKLRDRTRETSE